MEAKYIHEVTDEHCGLKPFYEPYSDPTIDVIAIHGIGAHPDSTWYANIGTRASPKYVNWLKDDDMLPSIIPNARIMRYGYESQWFGPNRIKTNLSIIANQFLEDLRRKRRDCTRRPMIFIAHCFGGLVLLKALIQAHNQIQAWPGIFDFTIGLIFFGTPFRGAEGMSQSVLLQVAYNEYAESEVDGTVLGNLHPDDQLLQNLVDEFAFLRKTPNKAEVACFFEMKPSNIRAIVGGRKIMVEYVVSQRAGCLDPSDSTQKHGLSRSHFSMNKFGTRTERSFEVVCDVVIEMVARAPGLVRARQEYSGGMSNMTVSEDRRARIRFLKTLNDLGATYQNRNDIANAEQKYKEAIEGFEELDFEDLTLSYTRYNLGLVYWTQGNFVDAEEIFKLALDGFRSLEPDGRMIPDTLNNLGLAYRDQRKLRDAEEMLQQACTEYKKVFGPDHRATLRTENNLGMLKVQMVSLTNGDIDPMDLDE